MIRIDEHRGILNMNQASILIPCAALATFSPATRDELLAFAGLAIPIEGSRSGEEGTIQQRSAANEAGPPDFTAAMARKLIAEPISPKSFAVLRVIAASSSPEFHLADAIKAAPDAETSSDLRGAWSGITRRARKILADSDADLIWWEGDAVFDPDGNYVDHVGRVSPLTHQSLRTAFAIRADE